MVGPAQRAATAPGPDHIAAVCRLLGRAGSGGNLVTDAQIAALAEDYGATVHSADIFASRHVVELDEHHPADPRRSAHLHTVTAGRE